MNTPHIEDELRTALHNSGMRGAPMKADGGGSHRDYAPKNIRELPRSEPTNGADLAGNGDLAAKALRENAATVASRLLLIAEAFGAQVRKDAEEAGEALRAEAELSAARVVALAQKQQGMSDELATAARKLLDK